MFGWLTTYVAPVVDAPGEPLETCTSVVFAAIDMFCIHQDTWHKDQLAFNEDQLQSLSTMLVGTSYCTSPVSIPHSTDCTHISSTPDA